MKRSLLVYFATLVAISTVLVAGARALGQQGAYLAQVYMLTPALAALFTRLFFHPLHFRDANLRLGKLRHYAGFWLASLGITVLSYLIFTVLGAVSWDLSGQSFLERLATQLAANGQDLSATLPPGFTPQTMLLLFFVGGLTVFNIVPGILTGFGEEFGHRGFMFPALYRLRPWMGLVGGGLIWYAWHWPVALLAPTSSQDAFPLAAANFLILGLASVLTFTYLAYVYVKSRSIWVTSLAHIVLNNSAASFSYLVTLESQLLANLGLLLTMLLVGLVLLSTNPQRAFKEYFASEGPAG